MTALRTLVAFLLVSLAAGAAFVPSSHRSNKVSATALQFKFLKELGLEKPSWLPDFGGKKEEEAKAEEKEETSEEGGETAEAPAEE